MAEVKDLEQIPETAPEQTQEAAPAPVSLREKWRNMPRKNRRRIIRWIIIVLILAAVAAAAVKLLGGRAGGENQVVTDVVQYGAITSMVENSGLTKAKSSETITLTTTGWTGSAAPFSQQVSCSIVAADTAVVAVDVDTPGTDADADAEAINAWALCTQQNPTQGAGTLTFYCTEKPTINIPVKVGVA